MRILIIDDYRLHAESLVDLLGTLGHEALYAPSYSEAQWLLDLFPFDLAILDFDMPQMSGPAIAAKLAERFPSMRSVIVSAHSLEGARRVELGSLLFLPKPLQPQALAALLQSLQAVDAGLPLTVRRAFPMVKYE